MLELAVKVKNSNKKDSVFEIEKLSDVEHVLRIYRGNNRACNCGSGLPCFFSLEDARGIFCSFICEKCEEEVRSRYRPEILQIQNMRLLNPEEDY